MGGTGGNGVNAGKPNVPNLRKSKGCMLCSLLSGDTFIWVSMVLGGEFPRLLVTPGLPPVVVDE